MRVVAHIKKLDDCFGQFLVRVICDCGACREIEPEALARLVGWSMTLRKLALPMRCSRCGKKAAEVVAVARPRPRGIPKNSDMDSPCSYGIVCARLKVLSVQSQSKGSRNEDYTSGIGYRQAGIAGARGR